MAGPHAGTLYAAKFNQTSSEGPGSFDVSWIELGHGSDEALYDAVSSCAERPGQQWSRSRCAAHGLRLGWQLGGRGQGRLQYVSPPKCQRRKKSKESN